MCILFTCIVTATAYKKPCEHAVSFCFHRLVRLMVAGTHGAEEVTAELLFVLCKENGVLYNLLSDTFLYLVCKSFLMDSSCSFQGVCIMFDNL